MAVAVLLSLVSVNHDGHGAADDGRGECGDVAAVVMLLLLILLLVMLEMRCGCC